MASSTRLLKALVLVLMLVGISSFHVTMGNESEGKSNCEICAEKGDCSKAYLNGPGQFCGSWLDRASQRRACCCPRDAVCALGNYSCNCKAASTGKNASGKAEEKSSNKWLTVVIVVVVVGGIIGLAIYCYVKSRNEEAESECYVVHQTPGYAAPAPGYEVHHHHHDRSNMTAGEGLAVGATAGLVGGVLLGAALADDGDSGNSNNNGGSGGGGYDEGYMFAGDF